MHLKSFPNMHWLRFPEIWTLSSGLENFARVLSVPKCLWSVKVIVFVKYFIQMSCLVVAMNVIQTFGIARDVIPRLYLTVVCFVMCDVLMMFGAQMR